MLKFNPSNAPGRLLLTSFLCLVGLPALADPKILGEPSSLVYPDFWHTPMGIHRGSPRLLRMFLGNEVQFNDPQGIAATHLEENGQESPQLSVVGVNSGQSCLVYNPDLFSLAWYGRRGRGVGQFNKPVGVAMLPDGRIAVADSGNHRVVLLQWTDGKIRWRGSLGRQGDAPGEFENPRWLAYDSRGRLFVSDTGNNRIQVFDADGRYLYHFGDDPKAPNSLIQPQGIAVVDRYEPYSSHKMEAVYVIDQFHGRIQKFSLEGRFQAQALPSQFDQYMVYFNSVALDFFNNLWVVDRANHQVHKFDRHLQYVDSWGERGDGDGQFFSPRGIAIYRHYGQVFVLEKSAAQYLWIGTDIKDIRLRRLRDDEGRPYLNIDFRLTEKAWVEAWITDDDDREIRRLSRRRKFAQGVQSLNWDGRNSKGELVEKGSYKFVIEAEASYSSATYYKKREVKRFFVK